MTARIILIYSFGMLAALRAQMPACQDADAQKEVAAGEGFSRAAQYAKAAEHYEAALHIDPTCTNAMMNLATAYMQQVVPGADSPENLALADRAREQFEKVLQQQPENENAMASVASLLFNQKKWDDAKVWYQKLTAINPQNKEAYYTLGVIAWTVSYEPCQEARKKLGMKPEDPGPIKDTDVRKALRGQYLSAVEEGLDDLNKALAIDDAYDDAMDYMNQLYRVRADLDDSPDDYKADIAAAEEWTRKAIEAKKRMR